MTDLPSPSSSDLRSARQRANEARAQFSVALANLRDRISPDRIKDDAAQAASEKIQRAKDNARATVQRHPFIAAATTIAGLALFFWRPARSMMIYGARGAWFVWLNRAIWSRDDK